MKQVFLFLFPASRLFK